MAYRLLRAEDAFWRESNQMRVLNTDLAKQLEATRLGARLWRLRPGQASTWHRHEQEEELYVVLESRGRIRVDEETLELGPRDSLLVEPGSSGRSSTTPTLTLSGSWSALRRAQRTPSR
jgi:uncharacterized cupin superfamily protein